MSVIPNIQLNSRNTMAASLTSVQLNISGTSWKNRTHVVLKSTAATMLRFHIKDTLRSGCRFLNSITQHKVDGQVTDPLTDLFGRRHTYLRISLSERCNLRCQYCMPAEGVKLSSNDKILSSDEIIYLARLFINEGVTKIRLTGGEPTVRRDLISIIENLRKIQGLKTIAMTTNGLTLTRQLVGLQRAGLDVLNISLDTLKCEKFEVISRRKGWERVMMGIDLALQLGYNPVKVNCVLLKGFNDDEIIDFVNFTKERHVDVRFIEYMPFSGNKWEFNKLISYKDLITVIKNEFPDIHQLKNEPNDTSKAWKVPGYKGQVGFITSMSEHFCGSCNRLRLTADGNLKVCLFGNTEISLRDALRSGCAESDLVDLISAAVKRKKKQHAVCDDHPNLKRLTNAFTTNTVYPFMFSCNVNFASVRSHSTERENNTFTHVNAEGKASMVDVTAKANTVRTATARGIVRINYAISNLIKDVALKKGDVLTVAQLAGVMGAKKTPELIPLCHNIALTNITVNVKLNYEMKQIEIKATVRSEGKTGVEMEALTAVGVAALTVYDMCKSVSHDIIISNICLTSKTGGKSGTFQKQPIVLKKSREDYTQDSIDIRVGTI